MNDASADPARTRQGILLGVLAYASWGLLTPVGKKLLDHWPAMTLNAVRMVLALLILLPFMPRGAWKTAVDYLKNVRLTLLLLLGGALNFTVFLYALTLVDATYATLGFFTAPLWTALLGRWSLKEPAGPWFLPTAAVMLLGGWFAMAGAGTTPNFHLGGMALAVLSGLGWAWYTVGLRAVAPDLELRPLMLASFALSAAFFIVVMLATDGVPTMAAPSVAWGWMAIYVLIPTTASLWLFNAAVQRAPAQRISMLVGFELAATAVFAMLILGDRFDIVQAAGLVAVLVAVTLYLYERARVMAQASDVQAG